MSNVTSVYQRMVELIGTAINVRNVLKALGNIVENVEDVHYQIILALIFQNRDSKNDIYTIFKSIKKQLSAHFESWIKGGGLLYQKRFSS